MFKQEIVNEYASRIYGDMRGMNVPYRIIQHYFFVGCMFISA